MRVIERGVAELSTDNRLLVVTPLPTAVTDDTSGALVIHLQLSFGRAVATHQTDLKFSCIERRMKKKAINLMDFQ